MPSTFHKCMLIPACIVSMFTVAFKILKTVLLSVINYQLKWDATEMYLHSPASYWLNSHGQKEYNVSPFCLVPKACV